MISNGLRIFRSALACLAFMVCSQSFAGFDVSGPVQRFHVHPNGTLWFVMETTVASTYCKPGWGNFSMYVPADHPQYGYYFAMLLAATVKGKNVYVANVSAFDGTQPCDITKTGYGLVLLQ